MKKNLAILVKTTDNHEAEIQTRFAVVGFTEEAAALITRANNPGTREAYPDQVCFLGQDVSPEVTGLGGEPDMYDVLMELAKNNPEVDTIVLPDEVSLRLASDNVDSQMIADGSHWLRNEEDGLMIEYWGDKFRFIGKAIDVMGHDNCEMYTAWIDKSIFND